jgi:hypothetical protein
MFQAVRECFAFSFKFDPTVLKLAMPAIINCLPVVVDDKVGNVDVVLRQCFRGVEDLLFRKLLAEGIPSACEIVSEC